MIKKIVNIICILFIILIILFEMQVQVKAHSIELDPENVIIMPSMVYAGKRNNNNKWEFF